MSRTLLWHVLCSSTIRMGSLLTFAPGRRGRWDCSYPMYSRRMIEEKAMAKKPATRCTTPDAASERTMAQYAEQHVMTGTGGEVHQSAGNDTSVLTTQQGIPVADDQNSLKIGARGPAVLEDFHLREKLFH